MPHLRCTHKLLKLLGKEATKIAREDVSYESDLDWYVNLFYVEGRKCLIFTNVGTLASFVVLDIRKKDVEDLPSLFRGRYRDFLGSLQATAAQIDKELASFQNLEIGKSRNRSVLGCMTEFVHQAGWDVRLAGGLKHADPLAISADFMETPMRGPNYIHAIDELSKRMPGLRTSSSRFDLDAAPTSNKLTEFIRKADCLVSELGLYGLRGFLFAVVTSPEMVMPSEWTELLLAGDNSAFDSQDEAMEVLGLIHEEYNEINQAVLAGRGVRPEDCPFRDDALSNFEWDAPASEWSHGFMVGFEWLSDVWAASLPEDLLTTGRENAGALAFFSSRHMVIENLENAGLPRSDLREQAEMARDRFYLAGRAVAKIGRMATGLLNLGGVVALGEPAGPSLMNGGSANSSARDSAGIGKVGRNQPCPCGSGRKYKYCHGK